MAKRSLKSKPRQKSQSLSKHSKPAKPNLFRLFIGVVVIVAAVFFVNSFASLFLTGKATAANASIGANPSLEFYVLNQTFHLNGQTIRSTALRIKGQQNSLALENGFVGDQIFLVMRPVSSSANQSYVGNLVYRRNSVWRNLSLPLVGSGSNSAFSNIDALYPAVALSGYTIRYRPSAGREVPIFLTLSSTGDVGTISVVDGYNVSTLQGGNWHADFYARRGASSNDLMEPRYTFYHYVNPFVFSPVGSGLADTVDTFGFRSNWRLGAISATFVKGTSITKKTTPTLVSNFVSPSQTTLKSRSSKLVKFKHSVADVSFGFKCIDSDTPGNNIFAKGNSSLVYAGISKVYTFQDACAAGNKVKEWVCPNSFFPSVPNVTTVQCPSTCANSACVVPPASNTTNGTSTQPPASTSNLSPGEFQLSLVNTSLAIGGASYNFTALKFEGERDAFSISQAGVSGIMKVSEFYVPLKVLDLNASLSWQYVGNIVVPPITNPTMIDMKYRNGSSYGSVLTSFATNSSTPVQVFYNTSSRTSARLNPAQISIEGYASDSSFSNPTIYSVGNRYASGVVVLADGFNPTTGQGGNWQMPFLPSYSSFHPVLETYITLPNQTRVAAIQYAYYNSTVPIYNATSTVQSLSPTRHLFESVATGFRSPAGVSVVNITPISVRLQQSAGTVDQFSYYCQDTDPANDPLIEGKTTIQHALSTPPINPLNGTDYCYPWWSGEVHITQFSCGSFGLPLFNQSTCPANAPRCNAANTTCAP